MPVARGPFRAVTVVLAFVVAGCDGAPDRPEPQVPGQPGPVWSVPVERGLRDVAVVGDVVVAINDNEVLGLHRGTGRRVWRRGLAVDRTAVRIAGDRVVLVPPRSAPAEVLDAATGTTVWSTPASPWEPAVYADAIYGGECRTKTVCTLIAYEVRTGRERWRLPKATSNVGTDTIGRRGVSVPKSGKYLIVGETLVDSATGRPGPARVRRSRGWFTVVAGDLVVTTDNDPPAGDAKCTVTVEAVDGLTGAKAWKNPVYSGRKQDDDCQRAFGDRFEGPVLIGAGTRIAATTATDRPQVVDLTTGRTVWRGAERGVPLESDGRTLLVRQYADDGPFTLLDWATGATRWTAPDSGLKGTSASWDCALTGRLAAVQGATGNKPFVQVYDVATGRDLGRYGSWLAGLGEDWVATTHGTPDGLALELVTL